MTMFLRLKTLEFTLHEVMTTMVNTSKFSLYDDDDDDDDCFYIALFSALEQTHCARM